jgi:glycerol uptake facilitator-like aquaporin
MVHQPSAIDPSVPVGKAALIASVGGQRGYADWTNPDHRMRRLLSEFIGMAGLTFVLSGGAAVLAKYGGATLPRWQTVLVLSLISALWLVAAIGGSFLARAFFGAESKLAATMPPPGMHWQAASFEAVITFGLVLMVLSLANGPKLNGPFVPLAVGAYILAWGTMGGPYDGASMNPARSLGPDVAIHDVSTWWVYLVGPLVGAVIAVGVAYVLRGPARAEEATAAQGTPLERAG